MAHMQQANNNQKPVTLEQYLLLEEIAELTIENNALKAEIRRLKSLYCRPVVSFEITGCVLSQSN